MKNNLSKAIFTMIIIIFLSMQIAKSQFTMDVNGSDYYGKLDFGLGNPPQAIGIGDFTASNGDVPAAALHVNTNLITNPFFGIGAGDVFRTDAPAGATYWRMFRNVSSTPTEFGTIFNNNDNHFYVQATNGSGDLRFNSGGANTRMTIASGGNVGISNTSPSSLLHVDGTTLNVSDVFRTDAPNGAATTWKMLRNGTEYGRIYNNNDNHFYIQANNGSGDLRFNAGGANTRMAVYSNGKIGIGTTGPPTSMLQINGFGLNVSDVFSTDAPNGSPTYWRMFRNGGEYGSIYNDNNDFYIQASNANGVLRFRAGGTNTYMSMLNDGRIQIGGGFSGNFSDFDHPFSV